MPFFNRLTIYTTLYCCVFFTAAGPVWAENEGQADLSLATEAKLSAENISDLGEVVRLCESAMEKGLDDENTQFAKHLLAATLVQRAGVANKLIVASGGTDPQWANYRRMALNDLEKAVAFVPEEPEALVLIAKLNFLPGGDRKRASEVLDQAIAIEDADSQIIATALLLRAGTQKDPQKRLADLNEALRLEPKMVEALRARGFHYAGEKKPDEAIKDLLTAEKISPGHPATIEALALVLSREKKFDEALEYLAKLQKLRPKLVEPLLIEARVHAVRSNMDKALDCLNRALKLQPKNTAVLLLRASLYSEIDKPKEAMADVDKVLELKPDDEKARQYRAMLLAKAGKLKDVVTELESILEAKPNDIQVQMQLGMLYTMLHKPKKAIAVFSKVLDEEPENVDALLGRASALLTIGKHVESIADYEKAKKLGADDSGMLNNFAWVLATSPDDKLRDGPRAVEMAKKACEQTEYKQAHILSTLAAAYAETGDFESAVKWSKKALELGKKTSDEDTQQELAKELESFKAGKPWREQLSEKDLKPPKVEDFDPDTPIDPDEPTEPDTPVDPDTPAEPKETANPKGM